MSLSYENDIHEIAEYIRERRASQSQSNTAGGTLFEHNWFTRILCAAVHGFLGLLFLLIVLGELCVHSVRFNDAAMNAATNAGVWWRQGGGTGAHAFVYAGFVIVTLIVGWVLVLLNKL